MASPTVDKYQYGIMHVVRNSFLSQSYHYSNYWDVVAVETVLNSDLEEQFQEKRRDLIQVGRTKDELQERLLMGCYLKDEDIKFISLNGLQCGKHGTTSYLGNGTKGVTLGKHADILLRSFYNDGYEQCWIVVYKVVFGRQKEVLHIQTPPYREPMQDADCHVSILAPVPAEDCLLTQDIKAQVFMFDKDENGDFLRRPRQCVPIACVKFRRASPIGGETKAAANQTIPEISSFAGNTDDSFALLRDSLAKMKDSFVLLSKETVINSKTTHANPSAPKVAVISPGHRHLQQQPTDLSKRTIKSETHKKDVLDKRKLTESVKDIVPSAGQTCAASSKKYDKKVSRTEREISKDRKLKPTSVNVSTSEERSNAVSTPLKVTSGISGETEKANKTSLTTKLGPEPTPRSVVKEEPHTRGLSPSRAHRHDSKYPSRTNVPTGSATVGKELIIGTERKHQTAGSRLMPVASNRKTRLIAALPVSPLLSSPSLTSAFSRRPSVEVAAFSNEDPKPNPSVAVTSSREVPKPVKSILRNTTSTVQNGSPVSTLTSSTSGLQCSSYIYSRLTTPSARQKQPNSDSDTQPKDVSRVFAPKETNNAFQTPANSSYNPSEKITLNFQNNQPTPGDEFRTLSDVLTRSHLEAEPFFHIPTSCSSLEAKPVSRISAGCSTSTVESKAKIALKTLATSLNSASIASVSRSKSSSSVCMERASHTKPSRVSVQTSSTFETQPTQTSSATFTTPLDQNASRRQLLQDKPSRRAPSHSITPVPPAKTTNDQMSFVQPQTKSAPVLRSCLSQKRVPETVSPIMPPSVATAEKHHNSVKPSNLTRSIAQSKTIKSSKTEPISKFRSQTASPTLNDNRISACTYYEANRGICLPQNVNLSPVLKESEAKPILDLAPDDCLAKDSDGIKCKTDVSDILLDAPPPAVAIPQKKLILLQHGFISSITKQLASDLNDVGNLLRSSMPEKGNHRESEALLSLREIGSKFTELTPICVQYKQLFLHLKDGHPVRLPDLDQLYSQEYIMNDCCNVLGKVFSELKTSQLKSETVLQKRSLAISWLVESKNELMSCINSIKSVVENVVLTCDLQSVLSTRPSPLTLEAICEANKRALQTEKDVESKGSPVATESDVKDKPWSPVHCQDLGQVTEATAANEKSSEEDRIPKIHVTTETRSQRIPEINESAATVTKGVDHLASLDRSSHSEYETGYAFLNGDATQPSGNYFGDAATEPDKDRSTAHLRSETVTSSDVVAEGHSEQNGIGREPNTCEYQSTSVAVEKSSQVAEEERQVERDISRRSAASTTSRDSKQSSRDANSDLISSEDGIVSTQHPSILKGAVGADVTPQIKTEQCDPPNLIPRPPQTIILGADDFVPPSIPTPDDNTTSVVQSMSRGRKSVNNNDSPPTDICHNIEISSIVRPEAGIQKQHGSRYESCISQESKPFILKRDSLDEIPPLLTPDYAFDYSSIVYSIKSDEPPILEANVDEMSRNAENFGPTLGVSSRDSPTLVVTPSNSPTLAITERTSSALVVTPSNSSTLAITERTSSALVVTPSNSPTLAITEWTSSALVITPSNSSTLAATERNSPAFVVTPSNSPTLAATERNTSALVVTPSNSPTLAITERTSSALVVTPSNSSTLAETERNSPALVVTPSNSPTLAITEKNSSALVVTPSNSHTLAATERNLPAFVVTPSNSPTLAITERTSSALVVTPSNSSTLAATERNSPALVATLSNSPTLIPTERNSPALVATPSNSPTLIPTERNSPALVATLSNSPTLIPTERNSPALVATPSNSPTLTATERNTPALVVTPSNSPTLAITERNSHALAVTPPILAVTERNSPALAVTPPTLAVTERNSPALVVTPRDMSSFDVPQGNSSTNASDLVLHISGTRESTIIMNSDDMVASDSLPLEKQMRAVDETSLGIDATVGENVTPQVEQYLPKANEMKASLRDDIQFAAVKETDEENNKPKTCCYLRVVGELTYVGAMTFDKDIDDQSSMTCQNQSLGDRVTRCMLDRLPPIHDDSKQDTYTSTDAPYSQRVKSDQLYRPEDIPKTLLEVSTKSDQSLADMASSLYSSTAHYDEAYVSLLSRGVRICGSNQSDYVFKIEPDDDFEPDPVCSYDSQNAPEQSSASAPQVLLEASAGLNNQLSGQMFEFDSSKPGDATSSLDINIAKDSQVASSSTGTLKTVVYTPPTSALLPDLESQSDPRPSEFDSLNIEHEAVSDLQKSQVLTSDVSTVLSSREPGTHICQKVVLPLMLPSSESVPIGIPGVSSLILSPSESAPTVIPVVSSLTLSSESVPIGIPVVSSLTLSSESVPTVIPLVSSLVLSSFESAPTVIPLVSGLILSSSESVPTVDPGVSSEPKEIDSSREEQRLSISQETPRSPSPVTSGDSYSRLHTSSPADRCASPPTVYTEPPQSPPPEAMPLIAVIKKEIPNDFDSLVETKRALNPRTCRKRKRESRQREEDAIVVVSSEDEEDTDCSSSPQKQHCADWSIQSYSQGADCELRESVITVVEFCLSDANRAPLEKPFRAKAKRESVDSQHNIEAVAGSDAAAVALVDEKPMDGDGMTRPKMMSVCFLSKYNERQIEVDVKTNDEKKFGSDEKLHSGRRSRNLSRDRDSVSSGSRNQDTHTERRRHVERRTSLEATRWRAPYRSVDDQKERFWSTRLSSGSREPLRERRYRDEGSRAPPMNGRSFNERCLSRRPNTDVAWRERSRRSEGRGNYRSSSYKLSPAEREDQRSRSTRPAAAAGSRTFEARHYSFKRDLPGAGGGDQSCRKVIDPSTLKKQFWSQGHPRFKCHEGCDHVCATAATAPPDAEKRLRCNRRGVEAMQRVGGNSSPVQEWDILEETLKLNLEMMEPCRINDGKTESRRDDNTVRRGSKRPFLRSTDGDTATRRRRSDVDDKDDETESKEEDDYRSTTSSKRSKTLSTVDKTSDYEYRLGNGQRAPYDEVDVADRYSLKEMTPVLPYGAERRALQPSRCGGSSVASGGSGSEGRISREFGDDETRSSSLKGISTIRMNKSTLHTCRQTAAPNSSGAAAAPVHLSRTSATYVTEILQTSNFSTQVCIEEYKKVVK